MKRGIHIMKCPLSCKYKFMPCDFARKNNLSTLDYVIVYYNKLDLQADTDYEYLEKIFEIFNIDHPDDYKASSLSVSDIVVLDNKYHYYCDSTGWKLLREEEIG